LLLNLVDMKMLAIVLLFVSMQTFGQWKSFILSPRGDTLNRVDMNGKKQGPWVIHVEALRGEEGYDEQGYFEDDVKEGRWVRFSLAGDKIAEENYRWGNLNGKCRYYSRFGGLIREESWRAVDPSKTMDTVDVYDLHDPTKVVDRVVVKPPSSSYRHGTWTYFDPQWGTITKTEQYFLDKIQTGNPVADGGDDDLRPIDIAASPTADSTGKKTVAKPQAILDYEKKNSGKKKIKARDGSTGL
jgi:hypothetical protein